MAFQNIPFQSIRWDDFPATEHPGETGVALWQTVEFPGLRIRVVTYSAGYVADHWCAKGHVVYCLEGEVVNELKDGRSTTLRAGMSYVVSDDMSEHRSVVKEGVKLLIVDGDFLRADSA